MVIARSQLHTSSTNKKRKSNESRFTAYTVLHLAGYSNFVDSFQLVRSRFRARKMLALIEQAALRTFRHISSLALVEKMGLGVNLAVRKLSMLRIVL